MSNESTRENEEALSGYGAGFQEGIPEEQSLGVLARISDALNRVSLTPGPNRPYPSLEESLQPDPSPETNRDRVLPVDLSARMSASSPAAASEPSVAAAPSMFKSADPTPKEELAQGACELPRTSRGDDPKTVKKNKDANCGGLKHKYELNSFQITGSNQEEEDETTSPQARSTQDALISTRYKNKLLHAKMKACDVLRGIMVPTLKVGYATASTPAERWDFSKSYHILKEHSQVTREQVLLWGSDCML